MASTTKESFKQDLVVSIRYRNELPPPPMPPKFLDIDTGGIAQYLTTSYASSLARREEPNIDADAEGGMPIDMVGIPGYFLGDESAIMAPDTLPLLDPADQDLMIPLEQLRTQGARNNVSFLRKNQYLSSQNSRLTDRPANVANKLKSLNRPSTKALDRNSTKNIKKNIQKGFDIVDHENIPYSSRDPQAEPFSKVEHEAWAAPKHPNNPRAKVLATYPILPDLETGTDGGNWTRVKFDKPPLPALHGKRDDRIDNTIFMTAPNPKAQAIYEAAKEAFEKDPKSYNDPGPLPPYTWVMTLPQNPEHTSKIRKILYDGHTDQPDSAADDDIYEVDDNDIRRIHFTRARLYPNVQQTELASDRLMALGLYDPASKRNATSPSESKISQGSAAYFYPLAENVRFRTDRTKIAKTYLPDDDDESGRADRLAVATVSPDPYQLAQRNSFRGQFDDEFAERFQELKKEGIKYKEEEARAQAEQDSPGEKEADIEMDEMDERGGEVNGREHSPPTRRSVTADADAMDDD
jgi:RNA polymerase II-associated factor 1